jgi:hypothetical protein
MPHFGCAFSIFVFRSLHSFRATGARSSRCFLPEIATVQVTDARQPDDFRV